MTNYQPVTYCEACGRPRLPQDLTPAPRTADGAGVILVCKEKSYPSQVYPDCATRMHLGNIG